jgi:fido (protein-threonine AMPylation protein)
MPDDPYVYPGTGVLRNKEGIRDPEELERVERQLAAIRLESLPKDIPISAEGYHEIHRHIFQDIYEWAGQDRMVDIAKGDSYFCRHEYIAQQLQQRFETIQSENCLRGSTPEQFADRAAEHISELNAIHPFREGNGRVQRAFLEALGREADRAIDLSRIEPKAWNEAAIESFQTGDCSRMREVIAVILVRDREGERERSDDGNAEHVPKLGETGPQIIENTPPTQDQQREPQPVTANEDKAKEDELENPSSKGEVTDAQRAKAASGRVKTDAQISREALVREFKDDFDQDLATDIDPGREL